MTIRLLGLAGAVALILTTACQPSVDPSRLAAADQLSPVLSDPAIVPDSGSLTVDATESPSPLPSAVPALPPTQGGTVAMGGVGKVETLNPLQAETEIDEALVPLLYESLLSQNAQSGQLEPELAEEWVVDSSSTVFTFTLQANVHWHDGQALTADDVASTLRAARNPDLDSLYAPPLSLVQEIDAPDDRTVVVKLTSPDCPTLAAVGSVPMISQLLTDTHDITPEQLANSLIGTGPFIFDGNSGHDGVLQFVRNDGYWGKAPYLDRLVYQGYDSPSQLLQAAENGDIDVAWLPFSSFPPNTKLELTDDWTSYHYPAPTLVFVAFNNDHPLLEDPDIRKALSMATDRQRILELILGGKDQLVAASLPPYHWAADPTLVAPAYAPDEALATLESAGFTDSDGDGWLDKNGERLELPVRTNGENWFRQQIATMVASNYRDIGIYAPVELVDWPLLAADLFNGDFNSAVFSWRVEAEPDQRQLWTSSGPDTNYDLDLNFGSFQNDQVESLLDEAAVVPTCSVEKRAQLNRQAQSLLADSRPYDFLMVPHESLVARKGIAGLEPGPFDSPFSGAVNWYVIAD